MKRRKRFALLIGMAAVGVMALGAQSASAAKNPLVSATVSPTCELRVSATWTPPAETVSPTSIEVFDKQTKASAFDNGFDPAPNGGATSLNAVYIVPGLMALDAGSHTLQVIWRINLNSSVLLVGTTNVRAPCFVAA